MQLQMYGLIRNDHNTVRVANRIFETMLYNRFLSEEELQNNVFTRTGDLALLKDSYEGMLVNRGRPVRVLSPGCEYDGTAEGITDMGELLVRRECGTVEKVYAGEVSVRGMLGYV